MGTDDTNHTEEERIKLGIEEDFTTVNMTQMGLPDPLYSLSAGVPDTLLLSKIMGSQLSREV